ncbi:hypothetical protein TNCV_4464241 [Trichonephila clavipes]|nr:hypothetical protein TNCV_4464241 [Trichonephila clavipes]
MAFFGLVNARLLSAGKCKPRDSVMNEKLIKIKELRIKYLQDLIEIETFDKDITDAAQLEGLIKQKAQARLEFAVRMGELKFSFLAPSNAAPTKIRMGLTRFDLNRKDQQSIQLFRQHLFWIRNRKSPELLTKNRKQAQLLKLRPIIKTLHKRPSRILINIGMTSSPQNMPSPASLLKNRKSSQRIKQTK